MKTFFYIELSILILHIIGSMRACYPVAVVTSIVNNLTFIEIIFLIVSIITVTNFVINVLIFPLLPLLLVIEVGVKEIHHLNTLVPMTRVTFIHILTSAWIRWENNGSDWAHSQDISPILTISWGGATK